MASIKLLTKLMVQQANTPCRNTSSIQSMDLMKAHRSAGAAAELVHDRLEPLRLCEGDEV